MIIENPKSDDQLPVSTRKRIAELMKAGYEREHLLIAETGEVMVDPEAYDYELLMRRTHPEQHRSEYMFIVYPPRIITQD